MAREGDNCAQKRRCTTGKGREVGEEGTGCCANFCPVLEKTAARLQGGERGNVPCMGEGLGWPLLDNC